MHVITDEEVWVTTEQAARLLAVTVDSLKSAKTNSVEAYKGPAFKQERTGGKVFYNLKSLKDFSQKYFSGECFLNGKPKAAFKQGEK